MGYRSNVAYAIQFCSVEDKDKFLATVPDKALALARESGLIERDNCLLFHEEYVKWYATRFIGSDGYEDVDAHEEVINTAKDSVEEIPHVGIFVRVGEESNDVEEDIWGEPWGKDGLPDWYDLLHVETRVVVGWDEEEDA